MAEERLTEAEWRLKVAAYECAIHGHDWHIVSTMRGPVRLICERSCGDPGFCVVRHRCATPGCCDNEERTSVTSPVRGNQSDPSSTV